jgi:predicted TIM-barrel fold metal-dependent hydrolase
LQYKVISADCHITEPPGTFVDRVPAEFRDRAPRILEGADGGDGWSFDGGKPHGTFGAGGQMGGLSSPKAKWHGMKWEDILPGNYDGAAHLKDMDLDGIDAVVVYPLASAATYAMEDRDLALACVRAYNDWMVEDFCSVDPSRLLPMCLVPVDDPMEQVLEEVERTALKGAREFFLPYFAARPYWDPYYDPLWKLASEAGCPVTIHREHGGKRGTQEGNRGYQGALLPDSGAAKDSLWVSATVQRFFSVMGPLTDMIFTGVFDRFPDLKVINGESNFGWVPFWRQTMDEEWDRHQQTQWTRVQAEQPPSSYLGRNVFVTILDDKVGFDLARTDRSLQQTAMFSNDYPHSVTIWPRSQKVIAELTAGMDESAKHAILAGNAIRAFNLDATATT